MSDIVPELMYLAGLLPEPGSLTIRKAVVEIEKLRREKEAMSGPGSVVLFDAWTKAVTCSKCGKIVPVRESHRNGPHAKPIWEIQCCGLLVACPSADVAVRVWENGETGGRES